jgi:hypothetical protein
MLLPAQGGLSDWDRSQAVQQHPDEAQRPIPGGAARRVSELGLLIQRGDWYRLLSETCVNVG